MNDELTKALPSTLPYVERLWKLREQESADDAASLVLRDYAIAALATPTPAAREQVGAVPRREGRTNPEWRDEIDGWYVRGYASLLRQAENADEFFARHGFHPGHAADRLDKLTAALATPRADSAAAEGAEAVAWAVQCATGEVLRYDTRQDAEEMAEHMIGTHRVRPLVFGDTHTPASEDSAGKDAERYRYLRLRRLDWIARNTSDEPMLHMPCDVAMGSDSDVDAYIDQRIAALDAARERAQASTEGRDGE